MAEIKVDTGKLRQYSERLSSVNSRINNLIDRLTRFYKTEKPIGFDDLMQSIYLNSSGWELKQCRAYLQDTASNFEEVERCILDKDPTNFESASDENVVIRTVTINSDSNEKKESGIESLKEVGSELKDALIDAAPFVAASAIGRISPVTGLLLGSSGILSGEKPSFIDPERKPNAETHGGWLEYEFEANKYDGKVGIEGTLGKIGASAENEWGYAEIDAYLGKAKAELDTEFSFMKKGKKKEKNADGEWEETEYTDFIKAEIGASVSVAIAGAEGKAGVGTDMLGAEVAGEGAVGIAKAEGKGEFSISDNGEITAMVSGEAMVAAVEGKASGTINFLGLEFKVSVGGYAGAAGVKGKYGWEEGTFVSEWGAALGLGFSIGFEIGFNETGWKNTTNAIADAAKSTAKVVTTAAKATAKVATTVAKAVGKVTTNAVKAVASKAKSAVKTVAKAATNTVKAVTSTAKSVVKTASNAVKSVASKATSAIKKVGKLFKKFW